MKKFIIPILLSLFITACSHVGPEANDPSDPGSPTDPGSPSGPSDPGSATPTLVSISQTHTVNVYNVGDEVDKSTLTVTAHYNDESSVVLTASEYTVTFDSSVPGENIPVRITYNSCVTAYTVTVLAPVSNNAYRSELRAEFKTLITAFNGAEFSEAEMYDSSTHFYSDILDMGSKSSSYLWEDAIDDLMALVPSGYTKVLGPQEFTWDDNSKGVEVAYEKDSKFYLEAGTMEEAGEIYIQYGLTFVSGFTFVDDGAEVVTKKQSITFTANSDMPTGDTDASNFEENFLSFLQNSTEDNLISGFSTSGYVQSNLVEWDKVTKKYLVLGKGSSAGEITFTFSQNVKSIKFVCQNYHKNWDNGSGYSGKSVDAGVIVCIDNDSNEFRLSEDYDYDTVGELIDVSHTYLEGTTSVSIYSKYQWGFERAFIHSMEITYIA